MNWFKKMVAAVLVAGTLCAPMTVYAADDTTAITATAKTQSTSMYVNKKCYSYDSPNAGRKQLELIYSGTKVTVVGSTGQYYKLDDGSYVLKKNMGKTCTNWTTFKYKTAKTMYAANNVVLRKKALSNGAKAGSVKAGQKLTVIGYTNTGYSRLKDGSYILTKYLNTSATSWKYFKYSKPVTMYATKAVILRSKALSSAAKTGSVKADQKLTVVGYTNTGFYKLNNGKYIKTSYATKTKPVKVVANPASDFKYKIDNNEVTITAYVGTDTTVVIPSEIDSKPVTEIGGCAFYYCTSLTSVDIPDSVTSIGKYAFYCTSLTSVDIPDSVTSIRDYTFYGCTSLTSVDIPDSVTSIGYEAFKYCTSLTSVDIPDSVTFIGNYAFNDCTSLTSVVIPDSVTSIGVGAFSGCESLTSVDIPDSVTSIGDGAFSYCTSLTSVDIPDSVTRIHGAAFFGCTSLTEFNVSDGNSTYKAVDGALLSKDGTVLVLCPGSVTKYTIPDSVTRIGDFAFSRCTSLTSVDIPDSVTSIGDYTFYGCTRLTSVVIPDSVTSIGYEAFYGCTSLTSVDIPDSVTRIGQSAFYGCDNITVTYKGKTYTVQNIYALYPY